MILNDKRVTLNAEIEKALIQQLGRLMLENVKLQVVLNDAVKTAKLREQASAAVPKCVPREEPEDTNHIPVARAN